MGYTYISKNYVKFEVNNLPFIVTCFDESLNKKTQYCELYLHVRYWDVNNKRAQGFGQVVLWDILPIKTLENFESCVERLDVTKMAQESMDDPNVNVKFIKPLQKQWEENSLCQLIDIGTCNLQVVHGAFQSGAISKNWGLKSILKGTFYLLHDRPAQSVDFASNQGGQFSPLHFCETNWIKGKCVAERL